MQLADTVERWLPGFLPYGSRITVRELLDHTSGMVDQDTFDDPLPFVRRIEDPALRAEMMRVLQLLSRDPTYEPPAGLAEKFMSTLLLLWKPGSEYHYSNIGDEVAGLLAAKVGGASLGTLLRERISTPLGLASAVYVPGGEAGTHHPLDYKVGSDGTVREATDWYRADEGASGAMIANARDEARFFTSLMQGKLLPPDQLRAMRTPSATNNGYGLGLGILPTGCQGTVYYHGGASYSTRSVAIVSREGQPRRRRPTQREHVRRAPPGHAFERLRAGRGDGPVLHGLSQRPAQWTSTRTTSGHTGQQGRARPRTQKRSSAAANSA